MKRSPNGTITVKPGDSISAIAARIYRVPAAKTRPYWHEFYRKQKNGRLVQLKNVNQIFAGETIYHRPNGAASGTGLSSRRPATGGREVSDGVTNPKTFELKDPKQLARIKQITARAKHRMKVAIVTLKRMDSNPSVKELLEIEFTMEQGAAEAVIRNYRNMLRSADAVTWHIQTEQPVTAVTGSDAYAFAIFGQLIAIYPPAFYSDAVSDAKRVGIVIHELAHFAFNAGHQIEALPGGGVRVTAGVNGADSYEKFAMKLR